MRHPVVKCGRSKAAERDNEAMRVVAFKPDGALPSARWPASGPDLPAHPIILCGPGTYRDNEASRKIPTKQLPVGRSIGDIPDP